ncbi:MAG: tetratricopeptide repeat protein, partial [Candidatus Hodarchaeota archaeon]
MSNIKNENLIQVEKLRKAGRFKEALQLVSSLEKKEDLPPHDRLAVQISKGTILIEIGTFDEALKLANLLLEENQGKKMHLLTIDMFVLKADALWHLGNLDNSLAVISQGEQALKSLLQEQSPDIIQREINLTTCKGATYWAQGNLDQALKCFEQNLALSRRINNTESIARSLQNLGAIYLSKGELDWALEHSRDGLALLEKLGNKQHIAGSLHIVGAIHSTRGELDYALKYLNSSLALYKELTNRHHIATSLRSIGQIYQRKDELNQALDYLEQSLVLFEEIGNRLYLSGVLFSLISVAIDKKDLDQAQKYLQRLQEICNQEKNRAINQRCLLAEALIQKTNPRPKSMLKAQQIFAQVANETIVDHELTVIAILNLCELLIYELKLSSEQEILEELQPQITRL